MGWEPKDFARDQIEREGGPHACVRPLTPATDKPGPYTGDGNDSEWGARLADLIGRIMSADFAAIPATYDRAAQIEYPGGVTAHSHAAADRFWMGLRAAFPDAAFALHHVIGRADPAMPPRAAVRWSLTGGHDGTGMFGAPSGAAVHVMGITHAEWGPWGLRREFTLWDEISIWKQIHLHKGDTE